MENVLILALALTACSAPPAHSAAEQACNVDTILAKYQEGLDACPKETCRWETSPVRQKLLDAATKELEKCFSK